MDESTFSSDYVSAGQSVPKSSSDAMLENKSVATIETEIFYPEDGVSVDEGVVMMEDMDGATPVPGPANGSASTDSTIGNDGRMIESGLPVAGGPQTNVGNGACASIGNELCSPSHRNRDDVNKFYFQLIEIIVLSSALLVVIVLFSIPTILFELPESEVANRTATSSGSCSQVEVYTGEVCRDELRSLQTCFSGVISPPPALNIPSPTTIPQEMSEMEAVGLANGLPILNPSPECAEAIIPFLCLSIFSVCDANNRSHTILRADCLELRDDICADVWRGAVAILGPGALPICEELPDIEDNCVAPGNITETTPEMGSGGVPDLISPVEINSINCSDGFFSDQNGTICTPECGSFNPKSRVALVLEVISAIVGVVAAVMVFLLLAFTVEGRKVLLSFPSIFFVYICIGSIIRDLLTLVKIAGNTPLMCGSRSFVDATFKENTTPYCTIIGVTYVYSLWQVNIWMLLFAVVLFWGVRYPFNYRMTKNTGKIRYVHIASVALAVFFPLVAVLVNLRDGYMISFDSPHICVGRDLNYSYYTFLLPLSIVLGATSLLLILIFWTIFQEFVLRRILMKRKPGKVAKGELKIVILIIYTIILGILSIIGSVYIDQNDSFEQDLREYIFCKSMGASADCQLDTVVGTVTSSLFSAAQIIIDMVPVMILIINYDLLTWKKQRSPQTSQLKSSQ